MDKLNDDMAVKKVVSGVYNPWMSKNGMNMLANTCNIFEYPYRGNVYYKQSEYLPFYCLPRFTNRTLAYIHSYSYGNIHPNVPSAFAHYDPHVCKLMSKLWVDGKFGLLTTIWYMLINNNKMSLPTIIESLKRTWDYNMSLSPDIDIYLPNNSGITGALNVIECVKLGTHFGVGKVTSKTVASGPFRSVTYLFGKYFLIHMYSLVDNNVPIVGTGISYERNYVPKPLLSLMFKKEYLNVIKAYQLCDKEIPVGYLELWVDKSLDDLGSNHKGIREHYIREIKKPMIVSGVEIKVFDDLDSEMYDRNVLPNFRSIKEQKEWVEEIVKKGLDNERKVLGLNIKEDFHKGVDIQGVLNGTVSLGTIGSNVSNTAVWNGDIRNITFIDGGSHPDNGVPQDYSSTQWQAANELAAQQRSGGPSQLELERDDLLEEVSAEQVTLNADIDFPF